MNESYGYQNGGYYQSPEPDYYTEYTNQKVKEARSVFSRYFLALFLYLIISNVVVILAQLVLMAILGQNGASEFLDNNIYIQWLLGVGPMYLIGFPIFYFIIRKMKTVEGDRKKLSFKDFILLFLVSEGAMYAGSLVGNYLNMIISTILGHEITNSTAELIENSPMWLIILIVVVIGPIIEEMLFRKFMIDRLGRYGDAVAITSSAIAFGFFHGNFYQFFYAAMLGFILGYIYTRTRDVKYTVIMHMLINFLGSILPMFLQNRLDEFYEVIENLNGTPIKPGSEIDPGRFIENAMIILSYSVVQYALMAAGIVLFITAITKRQIKLTTTCEYKIPKHRISEVVLLNAGVILFILFSLFQFALSIFMV